MNLFRVFCIVTIGAMLLPSGACSKLESRSLENQAVRSPAPDKPAPDKPAPEGTAPDEPAPDEPALDETAIDPIGIRAPRPNSPPPADTLPADTPPADSPVPGADERSAADADVPPTANSPASSGARESAAPPLSKAEDRTSSPAARARGEINFDDLKFELEKDAPFAQGLLSDEIRQLDGAKVKLRGFILPSSVFSDTGIAQFVLVRDNQECCFGPGAALFDCVMVQMTPGNTAEFVTRPVTVEGRFVIDTESYRYPPGYSPGKATHMAVFRIEGDSVR